MNPRNRNIRTTLNHTLPTVIVILATLFPASTLNAQVLQRGISVEMPLTTGASLLPDADNPHAWIVTVTEDGDLYFGVDSITFADLLTKLKNRPRNREQNIYIKADGRAPAATVVRVLDVARKDLFKQAFLLTAQPHGIGQGNIVPPSGMPVWVESVSPSQPVIVQISTGQGSPTLKINAEEISLKGLEHKVGQLLQNQSDRVVVLKMDQVPFADLAHVVDACNMAGAKTVVDTSDSRF
jgi:biopolymer transport protein ExbD